jgi:hypothetical protein
MDDYEDPEIDTRLGDLMGFTNFGAKPQAKKQRTSEEEAATSSNAVPLGQRQDRDADDHDKGKQAQMRELTHNPAASKRHQDPLAATSVSPTTSEQAKGAFPTGVPMEIFDKLTWKELEAYRKGVKQQNGDLAYFLPSFIEDPWAKLEKSGAGASPPSKP